jgi:predicted TIM-barrel fold metal-dependent hydrolase
MSRDGVVGVRLPFIGLPSLPDITTFEYRAFFRRLADLGWHVHPHVEGEDLPKILPTLEASGVNIVIDHLGRPDPRTGINSDGFKTMLHSIEKGRTWVKVSAGYRLGPQAVDYARELLRIAGPDRLVWASDSPFVGHEAKFTYQSTVDWLTGCIADPVAPVKNLRRNRAETVLRRVKGSKARSPNLGWRPEAPHELRVQFTALSRYYA